MDVFKGLGAFVIVTIVFFLGALFHLWIPWRDRRGQLGAFLIVATSTIIAWDTRTDPTLWLQAIVSIFGVMLLRLSSVKEGSADTTSTSHSPR